MAEGRDEGGAATIVALALMVALFVVALGAGSVMGIVVAHRVAQNAADLASLAAGADVGRGLDGCPIAREVAVAQHAELVRCVIEGVEVTVEVRVKPPVGPAVGARARAGPG